MKNITRLLLLLIIISTSTYSFLIGKYRIFPYEILQTIKWSLTDKIRKTGQEITQFDLFTPDVDIVFVGDSVTAGGNWHDMFPNVRLANRGVGGETTREIALRLDEISELTPRVVFLMAGINDIYRNDNVDNIVDSFNDVVTTMTEVRSVESIYLQSTLECRKCGVGRLSEIKVLNARLETIANEYEHVHFVNLNQAFSDGNGILEQFSSDGIHLNPYGYEVWREVIEPYTLINQ